MTLPNLFSLAGIRSLLFDKRSSLENPKTNLDRYVEMLTDGYSTYSGIYISEKTALSIITVNACVRIISQGTAMLDFPLYRLETSKGRTYKTEAREHSLHRLLTKKVNPLMTAFRWKRLTAAHMAFYGNSYSFMDVAANGVIRGFYLWHPSQVEYRIGRDGLGRMQAFYTFKENGQVIYDNIPSDYVLHFRGPEIDNNGLGMNPIEAMRHRLGYAHATLEYGAKTVSNGATMSGLLKHPSRLNAEAKKNLKQSWEKQHNGLKNAGGIAVLDEGLDFVPLTMKPADVQFLESMKFSRSEIASAFGVAAHLIGDLERATFSNIEHLGIEFVRFCLGPYLECIESEINTTALGTSEQNRYAAEFKRKELLQGDSKSQAEAAAIDLAHGAMTPNERRAELGYNPHEDGDTLFVNSTQIPVAIAAQAKAANSEPAPAKQKSEGEEGAEDDE